MIAIDTNTNFCFWPKAAIAKWVISIILLGHANANE
jgi:hypothetical protein